MPKDTFFNLSDEKREKVMRAAVSEFLKHGFEKGNVGAISKNAGIAKGSLYQYFENKKELFLYTVQWSSEFFIRKYDSRLLDFDLFDYAYMNFRQMYEQVMAEKELALFLQNVILGKYTVDDSVRAMLKAADEFVLRLIAKGKENGQIRKDIDDDLLALFLTGASMKIKESILERASAGGRDFLAGGYEAYDGEIKAMMELLKNGMGEKKCL
ncbi:MAG: TetR/AcrR family transcriptional regulator [Bacillota bacterium]